jgi:uncharacterized membrane protein
MKNLNIFIFNSLILILIGVVIIFSSYKRFKIGKIKKTSFKTQVIETIIVMAAMILVDLASFKISFLQSDLNLTIAELAVIIVYLIIDQRLTKRDSLLG